MRWMVVAALLAASMAGCTTDPTYALSGTFTGDRSDEDIEEVRVLVEQRGGDLLLRESFPEQFTATGLEQDACEDVRTELLEKDYLQDVGTCQAQSAGGGY